MRTFLTLGILWMSYFGYSQNIPSYIPTNGLIGYWSFDMNLDDLSGNNNHLVGDTFIFTTDRNFNPESSVQVISDTGLFLNNITTFSNQQFSFGGWMKVDSSWSSTGWNLLSVGNSKEPNDGYRIHIDDNGSLKQIYGQIGNGSSSVFVSSPIDLSQSPWIHLMMTYDGSILSLYIDGELISSLNSTSNIVFDEDRISIGSHGNFNNNPLPTRSVDEVGIWDRSLDSTEVSGVYNETPIVGITSSNYEYLLSIYPNPTNDYLQIDCGDISLMNGYSIKIINSLGQSLFDEPVTQSPISIDMNGWNGNGLYFLHLIDGSGNITDIRKIVLQ